MSPGNPPGSLHVFLRRVVIEGVERPTPGAVVIDRRQHPEGSVAYRVDGQVAAEVRQGFIEIDRRRRRPAFFPRAFPPIVDGGEGDKHALIPPAVPAGGAAGAGCTGIWARPNRPDRRQGDSRRGGSAAGSREPVGGEAAGHRRRRGRGGGG